MTREYQVVYIEKPEESAWGIIGHSLDAFNIAQTGDYHAQRLCFAVQDTDGTILGGVIAEIYWEWLFISLMWVKEELRGCGYGHQLLEKTEEEARRRGARHAYLDTFSFQAPDFYKRHGYQVFGELPDFPAGHSRYFLTKQL